MNKKIKNYIIFALFILILFIFTFTKQFRTNMLWPDKYNTQPEFSGLQFQNPGDIENLSITRSIIDNGNTKLIKMDVTFEFTGTESTLRILGTPQREMFLNPGVTPILSRQKLKGDFDKVNEVLFTEKLKYKEFYKKIPNYKFEPITEVKIPLTQNIPTYKFSLYVKPRNLYYANKGIVAYNNVFITNARVEKVVEQMGDINPDKQTFQQSGYYVNTIEVTNNFLINRVAIVNILAKIIFIVSFVLMAAVIWLDKKKMWPVYTGLYYLMTLTFYRVLGFGSTMFGTIILYPILAYIAAIAARIMDRDTVTVKKKDIKQSLGISLAFLVAVIILFVIPRGIY